MLYMLYFIYYNLSSLSKELVRNSWESRGKNNKLRMKSLIRLEGEKLERLNLR